MNRKVLFLLVGFIDLLFQNVNAQNASGEVDKLTHLAPLSDKMEFETSIGINSNTTLSYDLFEQTIIEKPFDDQIYVSGKGVQITLVNGISIERLINHEIYIVGFGWHSWDDGSNAVLEGNKVLFHNNDRVVEEICIKDIQLLKSTSYFTLLNVHDTHSYFINGVLVHNCSKEYDYYDHATQTPHYRKVDCGSISCSSSSSYRPECSRCGYRSCICTQKINENVGNIQKELSDTKELIEEKKNAQKQNIDNLVVIAQVNQSVVAGDPVLCSSGIYTMTENDFMLTRTYSSGQKITGRPHGGWFFSTDTRLLRGIDYQSLIYSEKFNEKVTAVTTAVKDFEKYGGSYTSAAPQITIDAQYINDTYQQNLEIAKQATLLQEINKKIPYRGYDDAYTHTGNNTMIWISETGTPVLFIMKDTGMWIPQDKSLNGLYLKSTNGLDSDQADGFILFDGKGTEKSFDELGLPLNIKQYNKLLYTFSHDVSGRMEQIIDNHSGVWNLEYSSLGKLSKIVGPLNQIVEYKYDWVMDGQILSGVTDADGDIVSYQYSIDRKLLRIIKEDDETNGDSYIELKYDYESNDGQLVSATRHEEDGEEYFNYYPEQKITVYTNHSGLKTKYYFNDTHKTIKEEYPDGSVVEYVYDSLTDKVKEEYRYNIQVNKPYNPTVVYLYEPTKFNINTKQYSDGSFEEWHWNEFSQITYYRDRDGVVTENVYDQGNLIGVYKQINNSRTQTYWASYDQKGLLYQDRVGGQAVWTYSWNSQTGYLDNRTATINGTLVREQWTHDEIGRVISFIDGENRKSTYIYNPKTSTELRNIVEITPDQLKRTLFYNSRKDLVSITEEDLVSKRIRTTTVKYDKRHLPVKIWNGEDLLTEYEYRADGKIVKEIRGPWSTEYIYNENTGDLSTVVKSAAKSPYSGDFSEYTTSYSSKYNSSGMLVRSVSTASPASDSELTTTQYTYDAWNRVIAVTDGLQSVTRRKITPSGRVSAEQTEAGGWIGYSYDNAGLLSQAGKVSDSSWNSIQNPVSVIYNADGTIQKKTDRNNLETIYSYNELGLLKQEQTVAGSKTYEYDRAGRITRRGVKTTTPDSIKHPEIWTTWKYNDNSRTVSVTEGDLYTTVWTMDAWGNPIQRLIDNSKPVKWIYDSQGRLDFVVDQYSRVTKYTWNSIGKIHRIDYPDESFAEYTYDAIGNLLSITDNLGVSWAGRYNNAGLLEHETGRPGLDKRYEYDALGRLKIVKTGGIITEKYDYSINGNKISFSSGNGPSFNYNKNEYGELVSETNRNGDSRSFNYDAEGRLVSISNFSSSELETLHDDSTLVKTTKSREGIISEISSDFEGRVLKASSSTGTIYYKYNSAGRLIEQVDESAGETTQWTYNDKGQKTSMRSGNRDIRYEYGEAGELCSVIDNLQRLSVGFTFDELGREICRKYGNGVTQFTERDVIGRTIVVKEISATGELLRGEAYLYDDVGRRYLTITENGAVTRYCYDEQSRLSQVYYTYNDQIVALAKDEAECVGLSISMKAGSPEVMSLTHQEYDLASALLNSMGLFRSSVIRQNLSAWKESFTYDGQGNRKTKTTAFGTIDYTYDDENRMITAGKVTYLYDKEGNLISEKGSRRTATYTYNTQNRMVSSKVTDIVKKQQIATDYSYDAFGRRTSVKDIGSSGMRTLYDGLSFDVIRESVTLNDNSFTSRFGENTVRRNESVTQTGRYAWIDDSTDQRSIYTDDTNEYSSIYTRFVGESTPLTIYGETVATACSSSKNTRGGGVYLGTDILGSMRSATNEYGNIEERYEYDAFGTPYQGDFTTGVNAGYTGKAYDPVSGLYNYGFRDYSPVLARFTTVDPIRDGRNWFTYVNNEPVNFRDPDGTVAWIAIGAGAGAVVGGVSNGFATAIAGGSSQEILVASLIGAGSGAITGAVAASGVGLVAMIATNAAVGAASSVVTDISKNAINGTQINITNMVVSASSSAVIAGGLSYVSSIPVVSNAANKAFTPLKNALNSQVLKEAQPVASGALSATNSFRNVTNEGFKTVDKIVNQLTTTTTDALLAPVAANAQSAVTSALKGK